MDNRLTSVESTLVHANNKWRAPTKIYMSQKLQVAIVQCIVQENRFPMLSRKELMWPLLFFFATTIVPNQDTISTRQWSPNSVFFLFFETIHVHTKNRSAASFFFFPNAQPLFFWGPTLPSHIEFVNHQTPLFTTPSLLSPRLALRANHDILVWKQHQDWKLKPLGFPTKK